MFISNKEKSDINESISRNKSQIENVVKHVAKLQVDMGNSEIPNLAGIRMSNEQLQKMYFGAKNEMKKMQQQLTMLREINDLIIERVTGLEVLVKRSRITIPKEKVQEMKDAGTWQDPEKRDSLLATFIKEKRKAEEKKERQRAYGRKYYANKKAKKAEQKQQELL
jgi:hypothetical protein